MEDKGNWSQNSWQQEQKYQMKQSFCKFKDKNNKNTYIDDFTDQRVKSGTLSSSGWLPTIY